jgi:hypothetical protein
VEQFREANRQLVSLAQADITAIWAALDTSGDPTRVRDILLELFPDLVQTYGDTAAVLGADWYDTLRDVPASSASFNAALAAPAVTEQAQSSLRWALGPLFQAEPDPGGALQLLLGAAQRMVLQPGRDTIFDSARRDPVRTGVARVPSGSDTCAFCIMLASRGAVYYSVESAGGAVGRGTDTSANFNADGSQRLFGNRMALGVRARGAQELGTSFHDNCDCVPTIVRSRSDYPDEYDPKDFLKQFREGVGTGRYAPE